MRKYFFQAVTKEGKQISGLISAQSKDLATQKLNNNGFSILTLEEPKEPSQGSDKEQKNTQVFEFEGVNENKKIIRGTIEDVDRYQAYKKLILHYKLEVNYLVNDNWPSQKKENAKALGIEDELKIKLDIEKNNKESDKSKKTEDEDEIARVAHIHEDERKFIVEKIDSVLAEVVPMLEENADYINPYKKREIEDRIDLLMRLKNSNSIDHLKSLTKRILDQISDDTIFLESSSVPEELKEEFERRKNKFQSVGKKFDKILTKGLLDLEVQIIKNTKVIKETVKKIGIIKSLLNIFYGTFFFLFCFCLLFIVINNIQLLLGINEARAYFYINSPLLWYLFGFSLIMSLFFYIFRFTSHVKKFWKTQCIFFLINLFLLLLYTIQFPVIFYWT